VAESGGFGAQDGIGRRRVLLCEMQKVGGGGGDDARRSKEHRRW
jgi:hypothetical protein